jgi:UDP-N-acetylglucosamine 2-epimerase (non-hydrolysing)
MRILNIVGARPNFMKIAPLMRAYAAYPNIQPLLVHTGQHYDERMSDLFFRQLEIPEPDINLEVGSGSHAVQTAAIMTAFEPVVLKYDPAAVVVVGDVNSTIACGLVAVKRGVRLVHVEAGLRSFDRTMPEEINRLLTDAISDLLFCTEQSAVENLRREGVADGKIFLVGNVMIDTLLRNRAKADDPSVLGRLMGAIEVVQRDMPVIFPIHPRTRKNIEGSPLADRVARMKNLRLIEPAGYLEFLKLTACARLILTDSGGIQEETTILKVPCLTLRETTERPVTAEVGSNLVVGTEPERILSGYRAIMRGDGRAPATPPLWDGHAAERIVKIMAEQL